MIPPARVPDQTVLVTGATDGLGRRELRPRPLTSKASDPSIGCEVPMCESRTQSIMALSGIDRQEPGMHPDITARLASEHVADLRRYAESQTRAFAVGQFRENRRHRVLARYFPHAGAAHKQPLRGPHWRARGA